MGNVEGLVSGYGESLFELEAPPERVLDMIEIEIPTKEEVAAARGEMTLAEFGRQVGGFKVGWRHGEPLSKRPYNRSTIHMIESGRVPISKAFGVAFRRWRGELEMPEHVRVISRAVAIMDIPPGAVICCGKFVTCRVCGRQLLAWPGTRYCPPDLDDCRKTARNVRRRERRKNHHAVEMD